MSGRGLVARARPGCGGKVPYCLDKGDKLAIRGNCSLSKPQQLHKLHRSRDHM